jgi:zinc transport system substrate-binding protein
LVKVRIVPILLLVLVGACAPGRAADNSGRLTVVAGFYPLAYAAERVGGGLVDVHNLTPPGVEPHDLELTPNEIAEIDQAEVVLYLGRGFAPSVEDAVPDAQGVTVDLLEGMPVRQGVPEGEGQGPAVDPHVWLDPVLYRRVVDRTERALARARPRDSTTFKKGAGRFDRALARLDREYRRGLTGCARHVIVTSHAAFGYLADRYGLVQEPISGLSPDAEPDPARLADLAALVRREGVTTIFTEELVSPKVADTLAREVGVATKVLNPLEGLTTEEAAAGEDYVSVMRANLKTLEQALGCPSA